MRFSEARGGKVVSRTSAERVGAVRRLVLELPGPRVTAVQVTGGRKPRLVPWERVSGFGPDAVVVDGEDALREPESDREKGTAKGTLDPLGKLVLTDTGDSTGVVQDIELDPETGAVAAFVTDDETVTADRVLALGSYAVIVRAVPGSGEHGRTA